MRRRYWIFFPLVALGFFPANPACHAQTPAPGFVEVKEGALPLIFTVPHGGPLKPAGLMNRRYGSVTMDAQTQELAAEIDLAVRARLGGPAHFVISHLHRSKMDPNRDVTEAAQDDPTAQEAWRSFHAACAQTTRRVASKHGAGLLLDLHGHRHEEPNVELGYLLKTDDLQLSDAQLSADAELLQRTSIRTLVTQGGKPLAWLVRGPASLGTLLEIRGQRTLPSAVRPQPTEGAPYYNGAYIVSTHGSKNGGPISAIQIECPWEGVRDTEVNRKQFAQRLADALAEFLPAHFKWKP
jgi:N-formylglutamate amidohydrolase